MTPEELQKLYDNLDKEEQVIRGQLGEIASKNPMVKGDFQVKQPNYGEDEDENAQEATDLDRNLAMERELESRLKEIIKTKQKIKEGSYGKCETCSQDIARERLKVRPVAALCITCARTARAF